METLTIDGQLEFELQELYLTGKLWLSDLEFMQEEYNFLRGLISNLSLSKEVNYRLDQAKLTHTSLKKEISSYMNKLQPLIVNTDSRIDLQLVEDYTCLMQKVCEALSELKGIKYTCIPIRQSHK